MSEYTPTVWRTGDVITAEKLNNIEEGIANAGGGESDFSIAEVTINFTFQEVADDPIVTPVCILPLNLTDDSISTVDTIQMETIPVGGTSASVGVITLPLYKGKLVLDFSYIGFHDNYVSYSRNSSESITASGNATINDTIATITGDCVLTIPVEVLY